MFKQRYLGNKKPAFLAGNTEQVHAAILESSKINDLFQNRSRQIFETSRIFGEDKDKDGRHLQAS